MTAPFRGPEPGTEQAKAEAGNGAYTPADRIAWAAFMLARDLTSLEALQAGIPVPRNKLNPDALASLGEPAESSSPLELTDELALRLAVAHPERRRASSCLASPSVRWRSCSMRWRSTSAATSS